MSDHYYSERPTSMNDKRVMSVELRGVPMKFNTDSGVFSRSAIDYGSRLLIDTMQMERTHHILDVGCGYGVIGLSASLLAAEGHVWMVDVNQRAVQLAKENATLNYVKNVTVMQSNLFAELPNIKFDRIISNPPIRAGKQLVHQLFEEALEWLTPNGQLWIVIQKKQGAPSAINKLEGLYTQTEVIAKEKGYYIIRSSK